MNMHIEVIPEIDIEIMCMIGKSDIATFTQTKPEIICTVGYMYSQSKPDILGSIN